MEFLTLKKMRQNFSLTFLAFTFFIAAGLPAVGEFYTTRTLLDQEPNDQRIYVLGLIDMYEFAREDFAEDPDDWLIPCMNDRTGTEVTEFFIDWLLLDPSSWRFSPAELFIEAMEEFCE